MAANHKTAYRKIKIGALLSAAALLTITQIGSASIFTWTDAGANNIWNTATADWTTGSGNVDWLDSAATPNSATFNGGTPGSITLSGTLHVNTLSFVTGGWTFTTGSLTGGNSGALLTINTGSGVANTITGTITDNSVTPVLFNGSGTLTLAGASTYAGATTIDVGTTIKVGKAAALPATTVLTVNGGASAGGTLDLNGFADTIAGLSGGSGTVLGIVKDSSSTAAALTVNESTGTTFGGSLQGTDLVLAKLGTGTLDLTSANTFGSGSLSQVAAAGGYTTVAGSLTATGYTSAGTLELGVGGTMPNSTVVVGYTGSMLVMSSSASALTRTAALELANGGSLTVIGTSGVATTDNFGLLQVGDANVDFIGEGMGEVAIIVQPGGSGGSSTLNFTSLTRTGPANNNTVGVGGTSEGGGATIVFSGTGIGTGATKIHFTTSPDGVGYGTGVATAIIPYALVDSTPGGNGISFATYDATAGTIRALVSGDYITNPGTITTSTLGNLLFNTSTSPTISDSSTFGVNSITLQNTGTGVTLSGSGTIWIRSGTGLGSILSTGTVANTINGPVLDFGSSSTAEAIIFAVENLTIDSVINAGELTVTGPGTLTLAPSSNNTWIGSIRVNSGTLSVASTMAVNGADGVALGSGATFQATGNTTLADGIFAGTSDQATPLPNNFFIDVEGSGTTLMVPVIGAAGALDGLTKIGNGTLEITAAAQSLGSYVAAGGTVLLGAAGAFNGGNDPAWTFLPGTTLSINSAASSTSITRMGTVTLDAANIVDTGGSGSTDIIGVSNPGVTLQTGASTILITSGTSGIDTLSFLLAFTRNAGATIVFSGTGLGTAASKTTKITFTIQPALSNGILPWALADTTAGGSGLGFATIGANGVAVATTTNGILTSETISAANTASPGTVNVLETGTDNTAGSVNSLTINGSGLSIGSGTVTIASGGILNLTGTNSINATTVAFGAEGIVHVITGSSLTISSMITGGSGLTKADAGTLTLTNTTNSYTGTNTINGGTLAVASDTNLGALADGVVLNLGGTLEFTGSTTSARTFTVNYGGIITTAPTTNISVDPGQIVSLTGPINGTTAVSGIIPLTSTLGVTGTGTLSLNDTVASNVLVSVASGAHLGGTGTLAGGATVLSGGHLAPGNSVGTMTTANLTLNSGAIADYEFNGVANDLTSITGTGALTIGSGAGPVGFNFYQEGTTNPYAFAAGTTTYDLIRYAPSVSIGGDGISALNVLDPTAGDTYVFGTTTVGSDNFVTVTVTAGAAVPEPASLSLLGLAAVGLLGSRRRRMKA